MRGESVVYPRCWRFPCPAIFSKAARAVSFLDGSKRKQVHHTWLSRIHLEGDRVLFEEHHYSLGQVLTPCDWLSFVSC